MISIFICKQSDYNNGNAANGEWIEELPWKREGMLEDRIKEIVGDEPYSISDYETDLGFEVVHYDDIMQDINAPLLELQKLETDEDLITALARIESGVIPDVLDILNRGNYTYYSDVKNEEELGEAVINESVNIPDWLENYIDYGQYGMALINNDNYHVFSDIKVGVRVG